MTFEIPYTWILTAAATVFVLFILMCLFVVWRIYRVRVEQTYLNRHIDTWRSWLAVPEAICRQPPPPLSRKDRPHFLGLWVYWVSLVTPTAREPFTRLAAHLQLAAWLPGQLRAFSLHQRLVAVRAAGFLHYTPAARRLSRLLRTRSSRVSLAAAGALLDMGPAYRDRVLNAMAKRQDWPVRAIVQLIYEHGDAEFIDMLKKVSSSNDAQGLRFLTVLLEARPELAGEQLARPLPSEKLCVVLRHLQEQRYVKDVIGYLRHQEWPVRLNAARALGRLGNPGQIADLKVLLDDDNSWVRFRVAQSIVALVDKSPVLRRSNLSLKVSERGRLAMEQALAEYRKGAA